MAKNIIVTGGSGVDGKWVNALTFFHRENIVTDDDNL